MSDDERGKDDDKSDTGWTQGGRMGMVYLRKPNQPQARVNYRLVRRYIILLRRADNKLTLIRAPFVLPLIRHLGLLHLILLLRHTVPRIRDRHIHHRLHIRLLHRLSTSSNLLSHRL
jgi:hypothetical protein